MVATIKCWDAVTAVDFCLGGKLAAVFARALVAALIAVASYVE
jgi:hypothetical protein